MIVYKITTTMIIKVGIATIGAATPAAIAPMLEPFPTYAGRKSMNAKHKAT